MKKLLYILVAMVLVSCGGSQTYETSKGTVVTYHKKGGGAEPSESLISYFLIKYETAGGKTLYESTKEIPAMIKLDSTILNKEGDFFEVMGNMKVGDSVSFELTAFDLFLNTFKTALPDSVVSEDLIKITYSFLEQVTMEEFEVKQAELRKKSLVERRDQILAQLDPVQMATDIEIIDTYLKENGIEAEKTDAGVRYVITEQGDGPIPDLGESVNVHYAGRLLTGEYFDTSMEDVAKEQELYNPQRPYRPFPISIWASSVISGWHDGISQLNIGSKATLYIPSPMAYGPSSQGEVIKANSVLVFDVELVTE